MGRKILGLAPFGVLCLLSWDLHAQGGLADRCLHPVARIVSAQGTIELKEASANVWRLAKIDALVCPGDSLHVGERSRGAILLLGAETVLRIDENTTLQVLEPREEYRSLLDLLNGVVHFLSRTPRSLEVKTPFVNAAVEGTEFLIRVETNRTFISVFEGRVAARNASGSLSLASNQSAVARAGEAPELRIVVRPRDAVRWALYYQPVLAGLFDPATVDPRRDLPPALREVLGILGRGDLKAAFDRLDRIPEPERGERFYVYRAALLLSVGRVDDARSDLDKALALAPESGEAYALRAVIAIARNDRQQALSDGREAVARSPRSLAAKIALSYALQANFDLEAARDVLLRAVEQRPEDSLAWARLAELWLSLGYLDKALEAAGRAASLAPDLGRTNTVLGFAALAQIRLSTAKAAFEKAIGVESENPLPRLGLGLAKIRQGALRDGRREIEIAAALDPNNALVRSYLGKAYFEEKRDPHDADQFALAKKLDPKDPTPWLYDAIRKQTENRPVEALRDLQKSIELNDNRAVYRSRLLLDEDLAARGAALARVHDDLGFEQLALVEGAKSLSFDPANHSAHRFLSDSYRARPRHEIARASELLQAQLLQPINIRPVQPQLSETDLNILTGAGPAEAAFNEFAPLFERDRARLDASGIVGNNGTLSDEVVVSGISGPVSFSAGQFHYETDGFRENNDLQHDIFNLFVQAQLTHELDLQFEYRRRKTDEGDLRLNFDPNDFSILNRREIEQETPRLGLHYAPSPRSDFIASLSYTDREENLDEVDNSGATVNADSKTDGFDAQAQYLFKGNRFNITAGLGYSDLDVEDINVLDLSGSFPFGICPAGPPFFGNCEIVTVTDEPLEQYNTYLYANVTWPSDMIWTFGFSYDSYDRDPVELDNLNPKAGLQWNFAPNARLRLAYTETVKRSVVVNQTLEPTQVAGFNQFFDDINGTETERYGIGIDARLTKDLYGGLEFSRRDLDLPRILLSTTPPSVPIEDQREDLYRAYLYWTPGPEWAVSAEFQFEKFKRQDPPEFSDPQDFPTRVETTTVPLAVRYFRKTGPAAGFFAELGVSYVRQEIDSSPISDFDKTRDNFVLVDAAIGYRLPNRFGLVSLEARNLLDEDFLFQDLNIQQAEPSNPRFIPDRTIMFRLILNF
jgi:tetratricopeptide (TPR) repeat protein